MTNTNLPETATQKYLQSLGACREARTWVGDKPLEQAWQECTRLDWLQWLVTATARAEYERVTAPASACRTCDELCSKFECPRF